MRQHFIDTLTGLPEFAVEEREAAHPTIGLSSSRYLDFARQLVIISSGDMRGPLSNDGSVASGIVVGILASRVCAGDLV